MDVWGFKTSVEEVTAGVMETAKELESEVEPDNGTELLQLHAESWRDEELLLMDEHRAWFPELECTRGEDAVKTGNDHKGRRVL